MKPITSNPLSSAMLAQHTKKLDQLKGSNLTEDQQLRVAASSFETIFTQQMLETMRNSGTKSEFLKESEGEKMFNSMLDQEYASLMSSSESLGLGEMIYQQMKPNISNK